MVSRETCQDRSTLEEAMLITLRLKGSNVIALSNLIAHIPFEVAKLAFKVMCKPHWVTELNIVPREFSALLMTSLATYREHTVRQQ